MIRNVLGPILLITILAASLLCTAAVRDSQQHITQALDRAAELGRAGEEAAARVEIAKAERLWQKHHRFLASVTDHAPLESVERGFSQLEDLSGRTLSAACAALARDVENIGDIHTPLWWNFL